jgi:IclR family acetate operon transcriptional repressor
MGRDNFPPPTYFLQSVDHALALLELFSEQRRLTLTEISKSLGIALSTASRLVAMLQYHGYVARDDGSRAYVIGDKLRNVAVAAFRELDLRPQIRPHLEALSSETGETIQSGTLQGRTVVFLDSVEGHRDVRVASRVGSLNPAHSLSTGKALLAELSHDELLVLYPSDILERVTPRTLGTRTQLIRELAAVRSRGYATAFSESAIDISTISVAIKDNIGRVRCAIGFATPSARMKGKASEKLAALLRESASTLRMQLF